MYHRSISRDLIHHCFLAHVMRQVVVALRDADFRERAVAPFAGEQECGDARGIGLEGQDHHVKHELNVFLETGGNARWRIHSGVGDVLELFRPLDPLLDFPHAGQVFVELLLVATTKLTLQRNGVIQHEVQDRLLLLAA